MSQFSHSSMLRVLSAGRTPRAWAIAVLAALIAWSPVAAHAGVVVSVETTGVSAGAVFSVTATGLDATAANHQVTFTPVVGPPVTVAASSSTLVDAASGIRRLSLRVPNGLPVGAASVRIVNTITSGITNVPAIQILALDPLQPSQAAPGAVGVAVTMRAQGAAAFVSGQTRVTFGAGITVRAVAVQSATELVATIDVSAAAVPGVRPISVTVPRQSLVLTNGFTVATTPPPTNVAPVVNAGPDQTITFPARQR